MSISSNTALSTLSSGLLSAHPGSGDYSAILNQGLTVASAPAITTLNVNESIPKDADVAAILTTAQNSAATDIVAAGIVGTGQIAIFDAKGNLIQPSSYSSVDIGGGANLTFDPNTLQGKISPVLVTANDGLLSSAELLGGNAVFTGSQVRLMIEVADPLGPVRLAKQFIECTTLTISIHRVKTPARACGYIGPKGYSRGGRTIAGTFILTEMGKDVLYEFLSAFALRDKSKDSQYLKVDQLPPFNLSMLFCDEQGFASSRRLMGIDMVTDGTVYSINDAFTERTISYVASDLTPLLPVSLDILQKPVTDPALSRESSPMDVMSPPLPKTGPDSGIVYA